MHSGHAASPLNRWFRVIPLLLLCQAALANEPTGRWKSTRPGKPDPSHLYSYRVLDLTDDHFTLSYTFVVNNSIKEKTFKDGTWTVRIKTIDPRGQAEMFTFFRRDGNHLLQCNEMRMKSGGTPPREFTAPEGSHRVLRVLDRVTGPGDDKSPNSINGVWLTRSMVFNGKESLGKSSEVKLLIDDSHFASTNTVKTEGTIAKRELRGNVTVAELVGRDPRTDKPMTLMITHAPKSKSLILECGPDQKPFPSMLMDVVNQPNVKIVFEKE